MRPHGPPGGGWCQLHLSFFPLPTPLLLRWHRRWWQKGRRTMKRSHSPSLSFLSSTSPTASCHPPPGHPESALTTSLPESLSTSCSNLFSFEPKAFFFPVEIWFYSTSDNRHQIEEGRKNEDKKGIIVMITNKLTTHSLIPLGLIKIRMKWIRFFL